MKKNLPITGIEHDFAPDIHIVSTTDLKGVTSSVNADFKKVSGFADDELLGKSHNVVRHPGMPPAAFQNLWDTLKQGKPWMGVVKNRCKSGDHYWVDAYVTPIFEGERVTGYQSVRVKPERAHVERAEKLYAELNHGVPLARSWQRKLAPKNLFATIFLSYVLALLPSLVVLSFFDVTFFENKALLVPAVAATALSSGLLAAWWVALPWRRAAEDARRVFANDVARQVYTGRNDELGQLQLVIQALQAQLRTVVWRIDESAAHLDGIARQTAVVVEQCDGGVQRQRNELDQVATAMNEMTATVQEIARNTQNAMAAAHGANCKAREGALTVTEAIGIIESLTVSVGQTQETIRKLAEDSAAINGVLNVITGIADQTNLLALNAAIEAARAGDQGRGFAVVAGEVRTLANRTQDSTKEIQAMIDRIQDGVRQVVDEMRKVGDKAQTSADQIETSAVALAEISASVTTINEMNTQIAAASEEQSTVAEEINRNLINITQAADATAVASQETARATRELAGEAAGLRDGIRQFGLR